MGVLGGRDGRGKPRLRDHMQPMHLGRVLGHRGMVDREVIDEHRRARIVAIDDLPGRNALAAAVADHLVADAVLGQLVDPPGMRLVAEIGEDDDVGDLADPPQRFLGPWNQRLAVHLAAEELRQQRPDLLFRHWLAGRLAGHRLSEIAGLEREADAVRLAQPGVKMGHHVEQHFVTIGDQQRTAQRSSSKRARISISGLVPMT